MAQDMYKGVHVPTAFMLTRNNAHELLRIAHEWKKTPGHLPFLLASIEELANKTLQAVNGE